MIIVVDFGGQTAHLIGRRLRQLGIASEYVIPEETISKIQELKPTGIIFSGGPASVYEENSPTVSLEIFNLNLPILGICYGWQLMAKLLGGDVQPDHKEYGPEELTITNTEGILNLPEKNCSVFVSHGDTVTKLPQGFEPIAKTARVTFAAAVNNKKNHIGVQFHPEVDHTEYGLEILRHFAVEICHEIATPLVLDPQKIIDEIKQTVGNQKVIMAVSGGVDSSVAAFLIGKAIGKNLIPVYVDSGLMRDETENRVRYLFKELVDANLEYINAQERYLEALKGITDSEQKRKIIGKLYIDIFEEVAQKHTDATFLGQGTIYSDVIESKGSKHASTIKSHHNVGGLPKDLKFKLIEPMRNFYKDEVRELGRLAGLSEEIVMQQPWPGPGYAINIMGEVTPKRLAQVKKADNIVIEEMKNANLYTEVFECWAVMTGAFSTAVKGDGRAFAEVVGVRSVDTKDLMTAQWSKIPYEVLAKISSRIVNEVPDVSRVVYDITTKPPATVRWE